MSQEVGDTGGEGRGRFPIHFSYEGPVSVPIHRPEYIDGRLKSRGLDLIGSNLTKPHRTVKVFMQKKMTKHCMQMLQDIRHPNVLRLEAIAYNHEDVEDSTVFLQQHSGDIISFITNLLRDKDTKIEKVFSFLQSAMKQMIEVLHHLMDLDLYHGQLRLEETYVVLDRNKKPVVKLANFKCLEKELLAGNTKEAIWSGDLFQLGEGIGTIIGLIEKIRKCPKKDTRHLAALSRVLKEWTTDPLSMKNIALQETFFWDRNKRTSVFTCDVPRWFLDPLFSEKVERTFKCPCPVWNVERYCGLLKQMEAYRTKIILPKYDGEDRSQYLKYVTGSYTHANEFDPLEGNLTVDDVFLLKHPDLCTELMKIVNAVREEKEKAEQDKSAP